MLEAVKPVLSAVMMGLPTWTPEWWPGTGRASLALTNDELCALVEKVAADRDRRAFAQLFTYFAPRLKGFGIRRGTDPATSEELAQETMLTLWRKADTFDRRKATVTTWVFTIVRNKRIDLFRREGFPEVDLSAVAEQAAEGAPADDLVFAGQAGNAIRVAMRSLPKEQLDVLEKAFFEDKSHRAIAEETGLPLGTVKSRIRLALTRLRDVLPGVAQ